MIKYIFKEDEVPAFKNRDKANPQAVGEALAQITEKSKGHLTPKAVVGAARDAGSILHQHFEWDNSVAAEKYRLDQARSLIRAIHVADIMVDDKPARAFLSIADKGGTTYRTVDEVLSSQDLQQRVLEQAHRDLIAFETRYRSLEEVCKFVRQAREKLEKRIVKKGRGRPEANA
jgi:hypothetical protein